MDTELLLVEDLLLLLLDDESGLIKGEGTLYYTLGGAVLVELALRGHIETVDGAGFLAGQKVQAVGTAPPSDPLLGRAYDKVAEKVRGVQSLLPLVGGDLRAQVIDRLLERGLVRRETRKTLGLFRSTRLPAQDPVYEATVLERVRAVLVDRVEPDTRTAVLAALLSASGTLPQFHPTIGWSGAVYTRGKELERGDWGAAAVATAVARTAAAIAAGTAAVTVGIAVAVTSP